MKSTASPRVTALQPKRVVVRRSDEIARLNNAILLREFPVFLDTNVVIWSFRLNEAASIAWQRWLRSLGNRLAIPAWVVHEYNQLSGKPEVSNPYKGMPRQLKLLFKDVSDSSARALDDKDVAKLKVSGRADLEVKLAEAMDLISEVADAVAESDGGHRLALKKFYEELMSERACQTDIHEITRGAEEEFDRRMALRFAPGGEDAGKKQNRCGDLVIWKEILVHSAAVRAEGALFVTNDVKPDWSYTPDRLILENGKEIRWSEQEGAGLRFPNPDLVAEFRAHTSSDQLLFSTTNQVIEALASTATNHYDAVEYTVLASAIRASRTPTDEVLDWFVERPEKLSSSSQGMARWQTSPDEVDMEAFEEWCRTEMAGSGIALDRVSWMSVFVNLFIL